MSLVVDTYLYLDLTSFLEANSAACNAIAISSSSAQVLLKLDVSELPLLEESSSCKFLVLPLFFFRMGNDDFGITLVPIWLWAFLMFGVWQLQRAEEELPTQPQLFCSRLGDLEVYKMNYSLIKICFAAFFKYIYCFITNNVPV